MCSHHQTPDLQPSQQGHSSHIGRSSHPLVSWSTWHSRLENIYTKTHSNPMMLTKGNNIKNLEIQDTVPNISTAISAVDINVLSYATSLWIIVESLKYTNMKRWNRTVRCSITAYSRSMNIPWPQTLAHPLFIIWQITRVRSYGRSICPLQRFAWRPHVLHSAMVA